MEHKKKNQTLSDKLETTNHHLTSFVNGLKEVAKELPESEFEDYLSVDIVPPLLKDETVYGTSIWTKMDIVRIIHLESVLKERGSSVELAIYNMNVDAICWMLEHLWAMKGVIADTAAIKLMQNNMYMKSLKEDYLELQEWVNGDMFERIQEYQTEIKKLQEVTA